MKKQKKKIAKIKAHNKSEKAKQLKSIKNRPVCRAGDEPGTLILETCRSVYRPDLKDVPKLKSPKDDESPTTSDNRKPRDRAKQPGQTKPEKTEPEKTKAKKPKPKVTPKQAVHQVVKASLNYHAPEVGVAPNHTMNKLTAKETGEKLDSVVGYPVWYWAKGGTQKSRKVSKKLDDLKVSLSIKPDRLVVDPGNGDTVTCDGMGTRWKPQPRGQHRPSSSPTCGYTYEKVGDYTATMTTYWTIHYKVTDGDHTLQGTQEYHGSHTRNLAIGEYQVIITG